MQGLQRITAGFLLFLLSPHAVSEEAPILPAPDAVSQLRKPADFDTSNERPLATLRSKDRPALTGTSVGSLDVFDIDLTQLPPEVQSGLNGDRFALRTTSRSSGPSGPLTIDIHGKRYSLAVVHQVWDAAASARHFSLQVLNQPESYARLSVSATDQITGTIVTPTATYRLLPAGPGAVSILRLSASATSSAQLQRVAASNDVAANELEFRHVQLEQLAQIQPQRASTVNAGRFLSIEGGRIGTLRQPITAAKVSAVIESLAATLRVPQNLQLSVTSSAESQNIVRFQQMVHGIPVRGDSEIRLDAAGNIQHITTQLVDPEWANNRQILSEAEAQRAAVREIENVGNEQLPDIEVLATTTLEYILEEGRGLTPYYTFRLRPLPNGSSYLVQVDAHTGQAAIATAPKFGGRVCERTDATITASSAASHAFPAYSTC